MASFDFYCSCCSCDFVGPLSNRSYNKIDFKFVLSLMLWSVDSYSEIKANYCCIRN